jgi:hypothetical protein
MHRMCSATAVLVMGSQCSLCGCCQCAALLHHLEVVLLRHMWRVQLHMQPTVLLVVSNYTAPAAGVGRSHRRPQCPAAALADDRGV